MDPPLQQSVRAVAGELVWISPPHGAQCTHASGRRHSGSTEMAYGCTASKIVRVAAESEVARWVRARSRGRASSIEAVEAEGRPRALFVADAGRRRGRRPGRRVDRAPWGGAGGAPAP